MLAQADRRLAAAGLHGAVSHGFNETSLCLLSAGRDGAEACLTVFDPKCCHRLEDAVMLRVHDEAADSQ